LRSYLDAVREGEREREGLERIAVEVLAGFARRKH